MDSQAQADLVRAVEQDPRDLNQPFSVWSCLDLANYLLQRGRALVSDETIYRYLQQLGYRVLRPVLSINSPDPDYETKAAQLEAYQELARQGQLILLYEDELDLNLLTGVISCWTKRGQQRKISTLGQNLKRYGFGAVNAATSSSLGILPRSTIQICFDHDHKRPTLTGFDLQAPTKVASCLDESFN